MISWNQFFSNCSGGICKCFISSTFSLARFYLFHISEKRKLKHHQFSHKTLYLGFVLLLLISIFSFIPLFRYMIHENWSIPYRKYSFRNVPFNRYYWRLAKSAFHRFPSPRQRTFSHCLNLFTGTHCYIQQFNWSFINWVRAHHRVFKL